MSFTAHQISQVLGGEIEGLADRSVTSLCPIAELKTSAISFYGNGKYRKYLNTDISCTILVSHQETVPTNSNTTYIRVDNVYAAFSDLSHWWNENQSAERSDTELIAQNASIHASASLGQQVSVGAYTVIGMETRIHSDVSIGEQVFVGDHVEIGEKTQIMPGVRILSGTIIGKNCVIYPNAVIGADGFGHVLKSNGHQKIFHSGKVIIEDEVEIGSNTVIDKGMLKDTIIRKGVKLDNLIQVAHGVEIGAETVIAAQTGISGSTQIGARSMIGGQVGIVGHVKLADGSKIQAKSGIASDIKEPNQKWYGYPVLSYMAYLRSFALFKRLPELLQRIKKLEEK